MVGSGREQSDRQRVEFELLQCVVEGGRSPAALVYDRRKKGQNPLFMAERNGRDAGHNAGHTISNQPNHSAKEHIS